MMIIAEIIIELEEAIAILGEPLPTDSFLLLPEYAEQYAYRRGARDAYQIAVEALKSYEMSKLSR
jgi:hypothetical protein